METWTRREMLAASALGTAGLAGRSMLAGEQTDDREKPQASAPASESIVLGFIGVGGMGSGLLNIFKDLGNIALRTGEKLKWDAAAKRITNHPKANALLTKEYRKPWALPDV